MKQQVSEKDRSQLDQFASAIQEVDRTKEEFITQPSMDLIFFALSRYGMVHETLEDVIQKITVAKKSFSSTYNGYHAKYLPEKGKMLESAGGAQEQVQEQEQQQQQQQQQGIKKKPKRTVDSSFEIHKFASWQANALISPQLRSDLFIQTSHPNVYLSREAHKLYQIMTSQAGEPIWKCVVNQQGDVVVITKNDYEQVVRQYVKVRSEEYAVILPLRGNPKNFLRLQGNRKLVEKAGEPLQAVKILLGFESPAVK